MSWDSLSDFLSMRGYGLYVWGSYGVALLFVVIEILLVRRRARVVRQRLSRLVRASAKVEKHEG